MNEDQIESYSRSKSTVALSKGRVFIKECPHPKQGIKKCIGYFHDFCFRVSHSFYFADDINVINFLNGESYLPIDAVIMAENAEKLKGEEEGIS